MKGHFRNVPFEFVEKLYVYFRVKDAEKLKTDADEERERAKEAEVGLLGLQKEYRRLNGERSLHALQKGLQYVQLVIQG